MPAVASPLLWPVRAIGAWLPDGWSGFARQIAVFVPFDIAYEASRTFAQGGKAGALRHARDLVSAEQAIGLYQEHAVQNWALSTPSFVMDVAKFTYESVAGAFPKFTATSTVFLPFVRENAYTESLAFASSFVCAPPDAPFAKAFWLCLRANTV